MSNPEKDQFDASDLGSALPAAAAALSAEDRADLVNALKNKLQHLAGQHSDIMERLSPKVRKRVDALRELQSQHNELEAKFFEERAALEAKYQSLYEPLYTKRYEVVNGVVEVEGVTDTVEEEGADKGADEKGVPSFWLMALKTNEILAEEISERDEEALKYLKDIKWCRINDPKGFKLEFYFDSNPFFKNSVLTKTYHMIDDDEPILEKAIGTEIEWYPSKCLTQKILKKKPRKGSKNAKPITKTENCESFFNFFNPPQVPDDEDDFDEDIAEELQNLMEQDYDIGYVTKLLSDLYVVSSSGMLHPGHATLEGPVAFFPYFYKVACSTIRDKIVPHAVSWFTGEAAQGDDFDDTEDEDDDDEDDEEEEEEDDEEESKNNKKPLGSEKSVRVKGGEGQQGEHPSECKQQ